MLCYIDLIQLYGDRCLIILYYSTSVNSHMGYTEGWRAIYDIGSCGFARTR